MVCVCVCVCVCESIFHQEGKAGSYPVMLCCVLSCHVMSCHVMSCHVMSCHVISCHKCTRLEPLPHRLPKDKKNLQKHPGHWVYSGLLPTALYRLRLYSIILLASRWHLHALFAFLPPCSHLWNYIGLITRLQWQWLGVWKQRLVDHRPRSPFADMWTIDRLQSWKALNTKLYFTGQLESGMGGSGRSGRALGSDRSEMSVLMGACVRATFAVQVAC